MAELQYNISTLQQCPDLTVGTPSVGDVVTVSSTSPLQFDLAPGGGGGGGIVTSIGSHDPIQVDSTNPAIPSISVLEADTGQSGVVSTGKQYFDGNKVFNDGAKSPNPPASGDDLANKDYVDTFAAGLQVKAAVRAATLVNGAIGSAFVTGQIIDGVTLAYGDRILIKNQTNQVQNGIYTVNNSGQPTRATDYDAAGECNAGTFTTVTEGGQANTQWVQVNTGTITPGSTQIQFSRLNISANVSSIQSPNTAHGTGGTLTGAVKLDSTDIYYSGYSGSDVKTILDSKAPLASPTFTGTPTTPNQSQGVGLEVANKNFVNTAITNFSGTISGAYVPTSGLTGNGFVTKGPGGYVIDSNTYAQQSALVAGLATKENTITGAATTITTSNLTANKALVSDGSGKVAVSSVTDTQLGYLSTTSSNVQTQIDAKQPLKSTIVSDNNTLYSFALSDATGYKYIRHTAGTAVTATVPSGIFSAGDIIYGVQAGAGQVTIQGATTPAVVTINSADNAVKTRVKYSSYMLICTASNTFDLIGDLTA